MFREHELIISIDENRVTTGTVSRAKKVGSRVQLYKADTWYEWDLASKARACESDWVFQIEQDEHLGPEFSRILQFITTSCGSARAPTAKKECIITNGFEGNGSAMRKRLEDVPARHARSL